MLKVAVVAVCVLAALSSAVGQSTFGSIVGVIHDKTDAVITGATVEIKDLADNSTRSTTSDQNGSFEFVNLKPSRYEVSVHAEGFSEFRRPSAELTARQALRVDVTLTVKSDTQTIEVADNVAVVNTEDATIGDSKDNAEIGQLPLNFRAVTTSPLAALATSANVQQDNQGNIALAGATANMVSYSVDGISTANIFQSAASTNPYPSSEGISELKVTAFNNSAEFSQVGDVTFTTKGGTNDIHGSLFEYLQNDALDARVLNFTTKAPKRFNTFGGSLGGPIRIPHLYDGKNKTFFFVDYEGNRKRISQPEQYLVPTQAEREGNLSDLGGGTVPQQDLNASSLALLNHYYPLPNVNCITQITPACSYNYQNLQPTPSSTNGIDGRIDQIINSKQQVYARYNWKNLVTNVVNPLLPNDLDHEHDRSFLVSHNYSLRSNLLNEFRFGFTDSILAPNFPIEGAQAIAQLGLLNVDVSHHPTDGGFPSINFSQGTGFIPIGRDHVGNTYSSTKQIADNLTYIRGKHTFRGGIDYRWVRFAVPEIETPSDDYGLFTFTGGLTGNTFGDFLRGLPDTSYFAVTGPRDDAGGPQMGLYAQDEWQVNSRLTVTAGLRWEWLPPFVDQHGIQANFDPKTNAILVNQYLYNTLGGPVPAFLQSFNACNAAPPGFRDPADAGYMASSSMPCTRVLSNGQEGLPPGLRQTYLRNFNPRVSLALRPFNDNKTVVRAGFGIFTVINLGQLQNNNESNPQASVHTYENAVLPNGGGYLFQWPNTIAASQLVQRGGGTIEQATDPRYRDPQSAQWNVTVERELTPSTALRLSYVGMNSYRLNLTVNWNQIPPSRQPYNPSPVVDPRAPFQNWGVIYETENFGGANYQAMEFEATHKSSKGLYFSANYTWAHNISDAQGDAPTAFAGETAYGLAVLDRFHISEDRGNVEGTRRQRFLLTGTYDLPFGQGRHWSSSSGVLNWAFGGWSLNTITLLETGPYLTPTINPSGCQVALNSSGQCPTRNGIPETNDQTNTDPELAGSILRPDIVGNPIPAHRSASNYFNIHAFAPTPVGAARIGDAGVGILEAPGTVAVSAGLAKTMNIHENMRLRFEATFTNVLNHTNFAPPVTNISSTTAFGVLDAQQSAENAGNRTGQVALRFDF
jgi:Carboxypeptidase regulatory-like domain